MHGRQSAGSNSAAAAPFGGPMRWCWSKFRFVEAVAFSGSFELSRDRTGKAFPLLPIPA
jgi:hypothetical protein